MASKAIYISQDSNHHKHDGLSVERGNAIEPVAVRKQTFFVTVVVHPYPSSPNRQTFF